MSTVAPAILAGDEFAIPSDYPSNRLDTGGRTSTFNAVGALEIHSRGATYLGSGVALSPHWVLTAGHNVDIDFNGLADVGNSYQFHLPDVGTFSVSSVYTLPSFSGFGNPGVNDDLALLCLSGGLPDGLNYPVSILSANMGMEIALVGFGRSGFGSYGYTSQATVTDRRVGWNVIDSFETDDEGSGMNEVFVYDFDAPGSPGSLGNDRESIIGPGDSGGAALGRTADGYGLVGINTFTEGVGGHFGDSAGGVLVEPHLPWLTGVTGLYPIPEPALSSLLSVGLLLLWRRSRDVR